MIAEKLEFKGTTKVVLNGKRTEVKVFADVDDNKFAVRDFEETDVPMIEIYKIIRED